MKAVGATALLLVFLVSPVRAQSGASTGLMGRVTDPSGAGVPGVAVTLTNVETGSARSVTTGSTGDWEARFLTPGTYRITFELTGFKQLRREGVTVSTAEMATVDVALEIGGLAEAVQVVANAEMVSSGSMTVQRTLDQKELDSLPTSARNFTQLLVIEPGVSADISELLSNDNASISPSVNGARTTNNSFVFNGVDVTNLLCCNSRVTGSSGTIDNGGGSLSRNVAPAPETLQEVKLQTSLYDAGTGRNGGGNFTLVSKSGTNSFRGSAYYYNQNDALMANDFFFNRAGIEKPILERHEGGGTIGGPIIRNKTFFFGSYQRTQAETSFVDEASNTVLLPRALTDDRSDAGINDFAAAIWDPIARSGQLRRDQPDLASAAEGQVSRRHLPDPSGTGGINCRQEWHAAIRELPGRLGHSGDIRAGSVHDEPGSSADHGEPVQRKVLLLEPAEPRSAGQRQCPDAVRARGHDLPADVLAHRPPYLQPLGAERIPRRVLPQPERQQSRSAYFTNAEFGIENPLDSQGPGPDPARHPRRPRRRRPRPVRAHLQTARASTTCRRPTPSATR